jgi:ion channel POLLUX/CASTOR
MVYEDCLSEPLDDFLLSQIKVSASKARSIIALSPDGLEPDAADSRMVRQVLSLQKIKQMGDGLSGHIVVELQDVDNKALVQMVGKGDVEVIVSHDLIGRMMLLSARSPWLATVLDDLMGFDGSEFYLKNWPELVGKPFGSVLYRFDSAVPVGVKVGKSGRIMLNPPDDLVLQDDDEILVLAEDDDSYELNDQDIQDYEGSRPESDVVQKKEAEKPPEKLLFCGWRRDMADMICELDYDVPPKSELWLFNNVHMEDRAMKLLDKGNKSQLKLKNITMKHVVGNPVIRRELISLVEVSDGQNKAVDGFEVGQRTGRREVLNYFTSILILSDSRLLLLPPLTEMRLILYAV